MRRTDRSDALAGPGPGPWVRVTQIGTGAIHIGDFTSREDRVAPADRGTRDLSQPVLSLTPVNGKVIPRAGGEVTSPGGTGDDGADGLDSSDVDAANVLLLVAPDSVLF